MTDFYPRESQRLNVLAHLEELRRRLLICLFVFSAMTVLSFIFISPVMKIVKRPADPILPNLIFLSPTEVFSTYIKSALLAGFITSFPVLLYQLWVFVKAALTESVRKRVVFWLAGSLLLFAGGILFSYCIAIPAALRFLLGFGREMAFPMISIEAYVSFFITFILVGGMIFEIPIFVSLGVEIGFVDVETLKKKRHYAVIIIFVVSALITPTQDVFNMLLFAFPMYLLYEIGVILSSAIVCRRRRESNR